MKTFLSANKHKFRKITAITGAGISAESGIPTFRGEDGLWNNFRAEDLATQEAFRKNPKLVWEWYLWRRNLIVTKRINPGHNAFVTLEKIHPDFLLITQNVDGFHRKAGSRNLIEIHGNIFRNVCNVCRKTASERNYSPEELPPVCPSCSSLLRPGVVWFGESYDETEIDVCFRRMNETDLLLIVGTSGSVTMPVALAQMARNAGALLVEVNPERTAFSSSVDLFLCGQSGEILPELVKELTK
ncbi:NAD-dependent deacylase [Leptospira gomenensis]|uniref:NAD-dependent protein deacylase n=1 Tax=Leptospira gomenensis TaxID=2484974 RepID=A0A5F1YSA2_9LEPT|nr:NAD-dependent deacylase [Leptospira gomenensis]TGK38672.1 NAD-dependent deacylase [Leptospira gomenensis]TGK44338.1 NAD-dependent deacylase [Leptospira gomenensis]TGK49546.1 NAD-dependent deacylase [Leptospira gomenensis]TGK60784.1 NAD-dependent deacylase [Leptospira gomenensis]